MELPERLSIDAAFYKYAARCFDLRLDVVFKGGCLMRHILREAAHKNTLVVCGVVPDTVPDVVAEVYTQMDLAYKEYMLFAREREGRLADGLLCDGVLYDGGYGYSVEVCTMLDFSAIQVYEGMHGKFYGVSFEYMLADKYLAATASHDYVRAEDILDAYSLLTVENIDIDSAALLGFLQSTTTGAFPVYVPKQRKLRKQINALGFDYDEVNRVCANFSKGLSADCFITKRWNGREWERV